MDEQVKYTEQERMEAFDFLEAQMALKTPMREWGLNLAAKLHSVRAEARQARDKEWRSGLEGKQDVGPMADWRKEREQSAARLAAAERLAQACIPFVVADQTAKDIEAIGREDGKPRMIAIFLDRKISDHEVLAIRAAWKEAAGK